VDVEHVVVVLVGVADRPFLDRAQRGFGNEAGSFIGSGSPPTMTRASGPVGDGWP
jgi:hypothetical protein